ncbi:uncharacterized protein LOC136033509 [Artemia franciscana]|uniref:uncharacterized protein LOC136033509 n=1 Tax=Artemia franciscana TaxID=6661 RepID=UPI0032DA5563
MEIETTVGSLSKLLAYLKEAIKEHRVSGGKRNASIACDRIGELYTFLIEENATLLRRDNDRLSEILRLEKENLLLKSNPLPFSSPIAPRSHITSYASTVKGPEKHSVILEPLTCNTSQNHRGKKVVKSETSSYAEAGEELLKKWFLSDDLQSESFYHKNIRNKVKNSCEGVPEPIALDSLEDIIKSLKPLKAPGPDGIVSLAIQKNFGVLSPTLLKIYNACLSLKYFPRAWKEANVIVLLKRGISNDGISSSYKPISLLSHLGKFLEKITLNRVFETNLESEWISNEQFGFVKSRSTIDSLNKLVTIVENDQKSKRYTLSLFFDIKGAFDNTWHPGILYKLVEKGYDLSLRFFQYVFRKILSSMRYFIPFSLVN